MKTTAPLVLSALLVLPAAAGTRSKEVIPAPAPAQPSLWSWFVGGSAGYLVDAEEAMYHGHIGVDTPWNVAGWNIAMYVELGYTEMDTQYSAVDPFTTVAVVRRPVDVETEVMPLTFNVKFERPLTGSLNAYMGAGLGVAFVDVSSRSTIPLAALNYSNDDTVFAAQVFAGLVYNVCESFEVYGGARWIYIDDSSINGRSVDFDDDVLFELGARFNF